MNVEEVLEKIEVINSSSFEEECEVKADEKMVNEQDWNEEEG
jgi:hypothetical protein